MTAPASVSPLAPLPPPAPVGAKGPPTAAELRRREWLAIAWPALFYLGWTAFMFAVFIVTLIVLEGLPDPEGLLVLGVLGLSTMLGTLLGQAIAIARIRGWVIGAGCALIWMTSCIWGYFLALFGALGGLVFAILLLTLIAMLGGMWSLASGRALHASWLPIIYGVGAMFAILEHDRRVQVWESGDKWAIWNAPAAFILFMTISLLLVYLVMRERHRLHRWKNGERALLAGSVTEKGAARARLTVLGWTVVAAAGLALTVGTLFIAPYLFRTGPGEREGEDGGGSEQQQPESGEGEPEHQQGEGGSGEGEQMQRAAQQLASLVCPMMAGLLLTALLIAATWRPLRRLIIVESLRRPWWPMSPTARIRMAWRLVEIGLADLGIEPDPSLDASELVRRSEARLASLNDPELLSLLRETARLRDRITFGLGVLPGDAERAVRDAERIWVLIANQQSPESEVKNVFRDV